ncbi:hypothetical protein, partial [Enterobacter cloacae complex sp. S1]|uniref:hypothetical protein n=1 Tax=Enterobacter cloacae complex sp. S1 TaxID=2779539 RepID=UPI001D044719
HPCASPRPTGNASAIYSRTEASLKALSYSEATLSLLLSNYWGTLSHGEREKTVLNHRFKISRFL